MVYAQFGRSLYFCNAVNKANCKPKFISEAELY